jgi:pimeloyl-ACP methyl ester carboxylesterase
MTTRAGSEGAIKNDVIVEHPLLDAVPTTRAHGVALGGSGGALPIAFGPAEARCVGWFHPSRSQGRRVGVVLCKPLGYEGSCSHETFAVLAVELAKAGFPVVRFDYHGTGDAPGDHTTPRQVKTWLEGVAGAIAEMKRLGQVGSVSLVGLRMGATFAAKVASDHGGVASLVLWAPCPSGRAFARELRVSGASTRRDDTEPMEGADVEALGYVYTDATLKELGTVDLSRLVRAPAPVALVIGRDDMPGEGPLHVSLRKSGVEVEHRDLPGFAAMMQEPREGDVAEQTIATIVAWLSDKHALVSAPNPESVERPAPGPASVEVDDVRETPIVFGPRQNLFGVMAEPCEHEIEARSRVAVLLLNVGTNYHIGPNRMYVKMARELAARGYRSLRFDLASVGDGRAANAYSAQRMYDKGSVGDVKWAMDAMEQRGCDRFVLVGLCSGAYMAFQTALADARVTGQILMNPRRLTWRTGDTLQSVMAQSYKSTVFYRRALLRPDTYMRLMRGEVDTVGIANRLRLLVDARARRVGNRLLGRQPHEEDVLLNLRRLCARGTDALVLVGSEDDGLDYLEFHLGSKGREMRAYRNFRMMFVEGTDHTFTPFESRALVTNAVVDFLDRRYGTLSRRPPAL